MIKENILIDLNPEQYAAVTFPNKSALILAGAGSGKTRVLISRIVWLIQKKYISPYSIIVLTFTNKAAYEIISRLSLLLGININNMWIGTFHKLCNRILRKHYIEAELPITFQILNSETQINSIKILMKDLKIDSHIHSPKIFQKFINNAKEQGIRYRDLSSTINFNEYFLKIYKAYEIQCKVNGMVDFAELLLRTYELFKYHKKIKSYYLKQFNHILIDEFQDTNKLQYSLIKLLSGTDNTIFAVGDDDQSIYAFRGSNIQNIINFKKECCSQNFIKLEKNYRSNKSILDIANKLISHNSRRFIKKLYSDKEIGKSVYAYEAVSDLQEAIWIAHKIKSLIKNGLEYSDTAIIYRNNIHSLIIEKILIKSRIPYHIYGSLPFYELQEIKYALAYLQLIIDPNNNSAFIKAANFPERKISSKTIKKLIYLSNLHNCSMNQASNYLINKSKSNILNFIKLIQKMLYETKKMNLQKIIKYIVYASGLITFYKKKMKNEKKIKNLQIFINSAKYFINQENIKSFKISLNSNLISSKNIGNNTDINYINLINLKIKNNNQDISKIIELTNFLAYIYLQEENYREINKNSVKLMTAHSAKGLEFRTVFITGIEEGIFPYKNNTINSSLLAEERRLMYVAITRAREKLYLSFSNNRIINGKIFYNQRSRFFDEFPKNSIKWIRKLY